MSTERQRVPRNPNDAAYSVTGEDLKNGFGYLRTAALTISEQDMRAWELVSDVPIVHNIWGYICLVLCTIIPGSGTFLAACIGEKYAANKT